MRRSTVKVAGNCLQGEDVDEGRLPEEQKPSDNRRNNSRGWRAMVVTTGSPRVEEWG